VGDVQDVPLEEDAEADEQVELVAQAVHLVKGVLAHLAVVERDVGKLDHPQAEPVAAPAGVALQQPGGLQRRDVAVDGALVEAELARQFGQRQVRRLRAEAGQDQRGPLDRLALARLLAWDIGGDHRGLPLPPAHHSATPTITI
jgi:hypothetical protein